MFVTSCGHSPFLAIEFVLFGSVLQSLRFGYRTSFPHFRDLEEQKHHSDDQECPQGGTDGVVDAVDDSPEIARQMRLFSNLAEPNGP